LKVLPPEKFKPTKYRKPPQAGHSIQAEFFPKNFVGPVVEFHPSGFEESADNQKHEQGEHTLR
jgi:hypothetical protein